MLYEVYGDLVNDEKYKIFCHQTNCRGVMGAGIAAQIKSKYPVVAHRNAEYCKRKNILGTILPIRVSATRICVNIYGQDGYGRDRRYTDYDAFKRALGDFAARVKTQPAEWSIGFPYRIGCGLAGGGWENHQTNA